MKHEFGAVYAFPCEKAFQSDLFSRFPVRDAQCRIRHRQAGDFEFRFPSDSGFFLNRGMFQPEFANRDPRRGVS